MRRWSVLILSLVCVGSADLLAHEDPFAFFRPFVITSHDDRQHLELGETVARVVPGQRHAIAVFSATAFDASGDRFIAWIRQIAALKPSAYVRGIGRFSSPPQLSDLATLTLDDGIVDDLDRCRPRRCGLKLAVSEFEELQRIPLTPGRDRTSVLQDAFRQLVPRRYLACLNESDLDVLDGFWGGLVRRILERRLKSEAPLVLETLRHRLESGEPPQ